MGTTNYPGGLDVFNVPTEPEGTSLSSAGSATRNHPEWHDDAGAAIEALEANATKLAHDHNGTASATHGSKLIQANTHQSPDTDAAPTSLHHTLGTGANQAAAGNHTHVIPNNYVICTSVTRPGSPFAGLLIMETDTHRFRVWDKFPGEGSFTWKLLPLFFVPTCRLIQSHTQSLSRTGSIVAWDSELEDNNSFFNVGTSATDITIVEPGLYHVDVGIQWNASAVPDQANAWLTVNGVDTTVRNHMPMRGNTFTPGFSQTLPLSGKYRFAANDVLRIKVNYTQSGGIINLFLSFFDTGSKINSRLELAYLGA